MLADQVDADVGFELGAGTACDVVWDYIGGVEVGVGGATRLELEFESGYDNFNTSGDGGVGSMKITTKGCEIVVHVGFEDIVKTLEALTRVESVEEVRYQSKEAHDFRGSDDGGVKEEFDSVYQATHGERHRFG